jgi:hypothetical protein
MTIWGILSGFVGGIVAWIVTTILGQPLQRFLQLRQEAAAAVAQFEDRAWIGNPEAKPPSNEWLDKRREAYDKAGTSLLAFANTNLFVTRALRQRPLGRYRCNIRSAAECLRTLAEAYPGTQSSTQLHRAVLSGLAIKAWPQNI